MQESYKKNMGFMLKREWQTGEVYAPHDLSSAEMRKWSKLKTPTRDVFDILNVTPLSLYKVCKEPPIHENNL
jgi:small subunit ribosomal protein S18